MHRRYLIIVAALFVTCLITANIIAVKILQFGIFVVPAGVVIFPLSYLFGDVLTEVYGYAITRRIIWLGFFCNLIAVLAIWLAGILPAAPFWHDQPAYTTILGFSARLLSASFVAYLVGEFTNSFILAKLKVATGGRWLWMRTIGSTLIGQGFDTIIFILVAFTGIIPTTALVQSILTQWVFKVLYEIVATPLTYAVVNFLKRREGLDTYDRTTDFNPLILKEQ